MQMAQTEPQMFKEHNKNEPINFVFWSDNVLVFCSVY